MNLRKTTLTPLTVAVVTVGSLAHTLRMSHFERWKSRIVSIRYSTSVAHLPNALGGDGTYSTDELCKLIQPDRHADLAIVLTSARLAGDQSLIRLDEALLVMSLAELSDAARSPDLAVENYIMRTIYELAALTIAHGGKLPVDIHQWRHDDVRGCLFDMKTPRSAIAAAASRPTLCLECENRLRSKQLEPRFLPTLDRELARIRWPIYFRVTSWVKRHPLPALLVATASSIAIHIAAIVLYEKMSHAFPWLT